MLNGTQEGKLKISDLSKKDIFDLLREGLYQKEFQYFGRCSEIAFLNRIINLDELPSSDSRFSNMKQDIRQHTINNDDWDIDWVFDDEIINLMNDNDLFIEFVNNIFHPLVRNEVSEWKSYLYQINKILKFDKMELRVTKEFSGRPVYEIVSITNGGLIEDYTEELKVKFSSEYIDSQVSIMLENIESNPNIAIGKAKELMESCAKTILDELGSEYDRKMEFSPLLKLVMKELGLTANTQEKEQESGKIAAKILGNLNAIPQSMAELRNIFGDGHGKAKTFVSLPPRYARLAVGTSTTIVYFLWETYQDKHSVF